MTIRKQSPCSESAAGSPMKFTDLFIKRPVLAATVSLLILELGLRAVTSLPIRQYPKTESATIVVQTVYFGADSQTMAGFITQPLEQAIAQAQGIDYMTSSSTPGVSLITVTLRLNYDGNRALTEISALVNSVKKDRKSTRLNSSHPSISYAV